MNFIEKLPSIALLLAALFLSACNKDSDPDTSNSEPEPATEQVIPACNLDSVFYNDGSGATSCNVYVYDTNNRIVRINELQINNQLSSFVTYTYNSQGKAAEEIYYFANQTVMGRQIFSYNASNQLTRIDFKGLSAWEKGYYPVVPDHIVMHYNAAGKRTRTAFYDSTNVLKLYFDYTYNQNKIFAAEYDATTAPATLIRIREFHFDNYKSADHALGYLNGIIPDMEKHNLVYSRLPAASWNSEHVYTTYEYNSSGYPISSVTSSGIGWGPSRVTFKNNCQ